MGKSRLKEYDLSICIVSWNVKELLRDCLASIRAARPELRYEVLVVDNGSRDGSTAMVKEEFTEVAVIRNRINRGFAAACNQAIRDSRGRYLVLLNPDTRVREGALEEMVGFLDRHPDAGGGGPKLVNPDGTLQPSVRAFPNFKSSLQQFTILGDIGLFRRSRREYLKKDFDYEQAAVIDQPMGAALFLRRGALEEVGLLDETFFLYFEEVDLCRRLSGAGWNLWYNPRAVIVHAGGRSTAQATAQAFFRLQESQFRYFTKHFGSIATTRFKLFFKPLFLLGLYWSIIRDGLAVVAGSLSRSSPRARERRRRRLRRRWHFLTGYLIDFLLM